MYIKSLKNIMPLRIHNNIFSKNTKELNFVNK